ncbi:uncharacterized protein A4U43_C04F14220 [Asparagus officinalis]|uniref:Uncharacterized protein n=1 Tax=Asparagus officinalis TaxID=4686 RepID=A0A5P1F5K4_ASPOF|nr:uncharacterized protein A4U43_C04F14220 [Asparagus officinalis]
MKPSTPRVPRKFRTKTTTSPTSMLDRLREVVFRLIMFTAISKGSRSRVDTETSPVISKVYRHQDSYRSEAVEDCIEFFKRSAGATSDGAKRSDASEDSVDVALVALRMSPVMGVCKVGPSTRFE